MDEREDAQAGVNHSGKFRDAEVRMGKRAKSSFRKKAALAIGVLLFGAGSLIAHAQKRVEAGLFIDYLGISQTQTNNVGIGGRVGFRAHRHVMAEGEFAYDYGVNFKEVYTDIANDRVTAIEKTSIGVTEGLFGPTLEPARGYLRPFVTLKGGFVDFRLSPSLIPYSGLVSRALGIRDSNLNGAVYPAVGVSPSLGPVGLRLEFGDLIYFNEGAHNNLRITFGPIVQF